MSVHKRSTQSSQNATRPTFIKVMHLIQLACMVTSTGRLSLPSLPVLFNTFNVGIAVMIPSAPSYVPASITASCLKQKASNFSLPDISRHTGNYNILLKKHKYCNCFTKWEPINKAFSLGFIPSILPCKLPIWSTHLKRRQHQQSFSNIVKEKK